MYLKPAFPDVKVPDPSRAGTPAYWLPAEGREVEDSFYWHRRLRDGDVLLIKPSAPLAPAATPAAAPAAASAAAPAAGTPSAPTTAA